MNALYWMKNYELSYNNYVYDLRMMVYYNFNVDLKYFYNQQLKNKVFNFYKNDFIFFRNLGIDYIKNRLIVCMSLKVNYLRIDDQ